MKQILSNYRYYVLTMLTIGMILGIIAYPNENNPLITWLTLMLSSKVFAILCGYVSYKLCCIWMGNNKIPELTRLVNG